ncbi:sulfatase [Pontiellaceae bacterium B12227]|nr:sulfatase [Pontiellaceae bacterium B12227]
MGILAGAANASIEISVVGAGSGYDETGVRDFRSTSVAKGFDADGNNEYGTEGIFFFGTGASAANNQSFSVHTQTGADWATFAQGSQFGSVSEQTNYGPYDNPTLHGTDVADWTICGIGVATGGGVGNWAEVLTFSIDGTAPEKFRVGIMSGTQGDTTGKWDPTGLRLSVDGGTAVEVTGLENTSGSTPGWVFFDVDLNGETSGPFSLEGQNRLAGQGTAISGVTFDVLLNGPEIHSFTADDYKVGIGDSVTLGWSVTNATTLTLDPGGIDVSGETTRVVNPTATTTYTLMASDGVTNTQATLDVFVGPVINHFSADVTSVASGDPVTLSWIAENFTALTLDPGGIDVSGGTSMVVNPTATTTYTLTASDGVTNVQASLEMPVGSAIIVSVVGDSSGYDELVNGFRSTNIPKGFDADSDDIYGSDGFYFFGSNTGVGGNNLFFLRRAAWEPIWMSDFAKGADFGSVSESADFILFDNPTLLPGPDVEDWGTTAIIAAPNSGIGTWSEIMTISMETNAPAHFRIGIAAGNHLQTDGRWDPTGVRISVDGGAPATVTGLDIQDTELGWVFFDVSVSSSTTGVFSIEGQQRLAGQGASIAGLTFDAIAITNEDLVPPTCTIQAGTNNTVNLDWNSQENKRYTMLKSTALASNAWSRADSNIVATPPVNMRSESTNGEHSAFYKVRQEPNIIVIYTDDQGYNDLSCFGSTTINTPNIDKMAQDGMKFTSFYSTGSSCTPARAGLMTGSHPNRVGLPNVIFADNSIGKTSNTGLNPTEITVADILKAQGYATACIGKWHLGHQTEFLPTNHGFDLFYGIPYSNDMVPPNFVDLPFMRNETVEALNPAQDPFTRILTEEAINFITTNKDQPFFLYLPHPAPHRAIHASAPFMERFSEAQISAIVSEDDKPSRDFILPAACEEIDWSVGEILKTLRKLNLEDDTLVIFTSDNGPKTVPATPLRGLKGSIYEGGFRVPTVMQWKGVIPAGSVCSEIACGLDFLPTFAELAGGTVPADRVIDGKNILPLLEGGAEAKSPHEAFYYNKDNEIMAVRKGDWKLINRSTLYNLATDIGESSNVAGAHPDIVAELSALVDELDADLATNSRPVGVHVE